MKSEPKIRFPEFDDSYSCSYLSDYLTVNTARNKDGAYSKEDVLSVSGEEGIVNQIQLLGRSYAGVSVLDYHIVNPDDIVYTKSPLKASPFGIIKCNKGQSGIVSTLYAVYTPKESVLPSYVEDYFALDSRLNRYLKPIVRIGAKHDMKVSNSAVLEGEVSFPSLSEQKKIVDFLSAYDKKIFLQKERVETLKEQKKGLLQKMFPKKGETVPELRFPGFTGDWERRKLGDMGSTFTGLSGKTKEDFGHGDAKFITYMNVFSNPIADLQMTETVEIDSKQNCVKAGDVFFTTSSETPEEAGMSCVMPENADNTYLNSFCFGYRPTEKFDLNYLAYVLRSESFRKEMTFLAQGISRYNISKNKVMEVEIPVPSLDEQSKVGQYFSNLDKLITLHQRKLETMQEIKKGLLQQMFC